MGLALYRRYRPDTFASVIGQNQVTVPLSRALDSGKLTHAYLFSGPRGCGKTSCARILARCINCEKGPTSHPCGTCESCRDLATGGPGSIDVVEIDAASHNGVDDARELRERAGFAPARDRYKIFILDEAHMVTQQGFNALLKIVEEPPEHVIFIFATTEPDKVIGTIRSRTHHYPFRLVPPEIMGPYLEQVCAKEHVKAGSGVLRLAMRAGGGSVRDTMSVLDQLMVGAEDGVITHEAASALLGFTPDAMISESIDAIAQQNGEALYGVIEKVVIGGFDPKRFVEDLLSRIRDLLVVAVGGSKARTVLESDDDNEDFSELQRQSESLGLRSLNDIADAINAALSNMGGAISPRMRLELLAARILAMRADELHPQSNAPSDQAAERPQHAGRANRSGADGEASRSGSGFIGSQRNAEVPKTAKDAEDGQSMAIDEAPVNAAVSGESHQEVSSAASQELGSNAAPSAATGSGQTGDGGTRSDAGNMSETAQTAQTAQTSAIGTDERWDALVSALPGDVREYVDRGRVPSVKLMDAPKGRKRLLMTFDVPLSQHAFALAVSRESVHGQTSVPKIVMHAVQQAFDTETMIFPSGVAANGEQVGSTRRMSPEQVANVKRQIALQKAGLSASNLGSAMKPVASSHNEATRQNHGGAASQGHADSPTDGHHRKRPQGGNDGHGSQNAANPHGVRDSRVVESEQGWPMPHGNEHAGRTESSNRSDDLRHSHNVKHVALPDLNNSDDPWAPTVAADSNPSQTAETNPSGQPDANDAGTNSATGAVSAASAASTPGPVSTAAAYSATGSGSVPASDDRSRGSVQAAKSRPTQLVRVDMSENGQDGPHAEPQGNAHSEKRMDPSQDTYSMDDPALNTDQSLNMDDIRQLFNVKKIEEFAADDPKNPRNVQRRNNQQHAQGNE
ncbi:MAG: DNA polymerase III subunit gamma/tau [Bifidobacterium sp.]|uniref:DNA-directed DNA polymerase n=2 Tax=Bifidobacterium TaxID=1678 RepID=A0AB39UAT1_9BIFI